MTELYSALGLAPDATPEEIGKAHKRAVRQHHPDAGGDREAFERVQRAYVVLRDPDRRARYDATGDAEPPADDRMEAMAQLLSSAFDRAIASAENLLDHVDLAAKMQLLLKSDRSQLKQKLSHLGGERKRFAKVRKRLKFNGASGNILDVMLADRLRAIEAAEQQCRMLIEKLTAAITYSEQYGYEVDKVAPQTGTFFTTRSATW